MSLSSILSSVPSPAVLALPSLISALVMLPWLLTAQRAAPKELPEPLPDKLAPYTVFLEADGGQDGSIDSPLYADMILSRWPPSPSGPILLDRWHSFGPAPGEEPELDAPELSRALSPLRRADREVIPVRAPLTPWRLRGASLLVINLPMGDRRGFTLAESLAVAAFVRAGGGLLLIGDSADRFFHIGMTADLQRALGFRLRPVTAASDDPADLLAPDAFAALRLDVPEAHPIGRGAGRVALRAAGTVEGMGAVLQSPASGWLDGWDGSRAFTGDLRRDPGEAQGAATVIGALEVGAGRVVYLGDRAAWGEDMIGLEGNERLFYNALSWLLRAGEPGAGRPGLPAPLPPDLYVLETPGTPGCATRTPEGSSALWTLLQRQKERPACVTRLPEQGSTGGREDGVPILLLHGQEFLPGGQAGERTQLRVVEGPELSAPGRAITVDDPSARWQGGALEVHPAPFDAAGWTIRARDDQGRPVVAQQGRRWVLLDGRILRNSGMGVRDGSGTTGKRTGRLFVLWLLEEMGRAE